MDKLRAAAALAYKLRHDPEATDQEREDAQTALDALRAELAAEPELEPEPEPEPEPEKPRRRRRTPWIKRSKRGA